MPAKRVLSCEEEAKLKELFHSDLGVYDVCKAFGADYRVVKRYWNQWFDAQAFRDRCSRLNRLHKLGEKNPMFGKVGLEHHSAKDKVLTTQKYIAVWAPTWYTGNIENGRVLEHIVVWCEANGYTELPAGWVVHHLDHSRTNNAPDNLLAMTISDHLSYHNTKSKERATTILQRSREKALPKRLPSL